MTSENEPPGGSDSRPGGPRLERLEKARGRLPGNTSVRIVRNPSFRRRGGSLEATAKVLEAEGGVGKALAVFRMLLFGRPIPTYAEQEERLTKVTGLAIFASDNISSSAYATEETMRALALAGAGALALTMPLTITLVVILAIVVMSYLQAIRAYPSGGGSYIVASQNLGAIPGLVAAAALLVDYVLTVSVSVAGGVLAINSAFPASSDYRVWLGVGFIALLTLGNLRGIREAGLVFAGPTYFYVLSVLGLVGLGIFRLVTGDIPVAPLPPETYQPPFEPLGAFLILRAFASGAVGLTGTEAVANGVTAFRKPEARNASVVLLVMGTLFATLFIGISLLATAIGVQPDNSAQQVTVLSMIARSIVGDGWYFYVVQIATVVILTLAANTSFSGFPRLASILATDRFMPRQFAQRGDRLAFTFGILVLAAVSAALLAYKQGSVTELIPLYTVGVFIAFTLSQAGLVRFWMRRRTRGWHVSAAINGAGAVVTGIVALVVSYTKFALGAWLVLAVIPLIVYFLYRIHRHYRAIEDDLLIPAATSVHLATRRPRVIVPVSRLDRAALEALSVARGLGGELSAVHVSFDEEGAGQFRDRWKRVVGDAVPLDIIVSPYRALLQPLLAYIDLMDGDRDRTRPLVVVLAEFVPRHWWDAFLHNQTAFRLKLRLFFRRNTVVMDVPYHLDDPPDFKTVDRDEEQRAHR
ncbi:MAG: APC family permease [Chloroflexota bacterium]|nr:APC family permease [Chloroflexota bacterium]